MDGPAAEHDLVLGGRLEGQAPEGDPLVYLTDCDPSALSPQQPFQAEIVASPGSDLVVHPNNFLAEHHGAHPFPEPSGMR